MRSPFRLRERPIGPDSVTPPPTIDEKRLRLQESDLFRGLGPDDMRDVERITRMRTCRCGETVFAPDDADETLFIIKTGSVRLYRLTRDGRRLITATLGAGAIFGEMALAGEAMRSTFAEAASESTVCVMSRADLEALMLAKPMVALRLAQILSCRLAEAEQRLEHVTFETIETRLARLLLLLADDCGSEVGGVSHQNLADMIGTHRETVTRVLHTLSSDGIIEVGRLSIRILGPDRLRALAVGAPRREPSHERGL